MTEMAHIRGTVFVAGRAFPVDMDVPADLVLDENASYSIGPFMVNDGCEGEHSPATNPNCSMAPQRAPTLTMIAGGGTQ